MPAPVGCPNRLYNIMLDCWLQEPDDCPTFKSLKAMLEDYYVSGAEGVYRKPWQ